VHNIAAETFITILELTKCTKYVFGLSATTKRPDDRHKMYYKFFDDIIIKELAYTQKVQLNLYGFIDYTDNIYDHKITKEILKRDKFIFMNSMQCIFQNKNRNKLICDIICDLIEKDP